MYAELERKKCLQCKEEKNLELFRFRAKKRNGTYESYCKACERANNKLWYAENKERMRQRDFVRNCERFGLSVAEYRRRAEMQEGKCAICKYPETTRRGGVVKNLAIDHCHVSGKIRSLLCNGCNTAIGLFKEDPARLSAAVRYLKKFKN